MSWIWDGPNLSAAFKAKVLKNRAQGLCGCSGQLVDPGGTSLERRYCAKCLRGDRARRREQRKNADRCKRCGKRFDGEVPRNRTCAGCQSHEDERTKTRAHRVGVCRNCSNALPEGWALRQCERCRDRDNERRRVARGATPETPKQAARRLGLCDCGQPRAHGRTDCTKCRNAKSAAKREAAKRAGLCQRCLKAPSLPGKAWCGGCSGQCKARYDDRRAKGLCCHCSERPALLGETRCEPCKAKHHENLARRYVTAKAEGLCVACRQRPPRPGRVDCEPCVAKYRGEKTSDE